jgi:hypothetical protein
MPFGMNFAFVILEFIEKYYLTKRMCYNKNYMGRKEGRRMEGKIKEAIEKYVESHPEVKEILKQFHISQEVYEKALNSITVKVHGVKPICTLTGKGSYNVNVSGTT